MARIFVQDVCEMAIEATYGGRPHVTVLHFANDEGAQSDAAKAKDILNNWQDHMLVQVSNQMTLTGARWFSLDPDDNNAGTLTLDPGKPTVGPAAVAGLPASNTYLIHKVTASRPRGKRNGRIFQSGVLEDFVNEAGLVDAAVAGPKQAALDAFLSGVNDDQWGVGGGSGLVVLNHTPESRMKGTQEVTLTYRPVTALTLDLKIAHQRDRLR